MTLVKDEGLTVNLTEFEKLTVKTITPPLEDYLKTISKTGDTWYVRVLNDNLLHIVSNSTQWQYYNNNYGYRLWQGPSIVKHFSDFHNFSYNWNIVKPLLVYKLERVLDDFMETVTENGDVSAPTPSEFQSTKERLSGLLNGFYRAPFTVQRLLELLLEPNKHYRKFDKYARGLEKVGSGCVLVYTSFSLDK